NVVQNGTLLAESANGGKGGTITLQSLQDTTLTNGSFTSVKGNGTGSAGSVKIIATHNAYFNDSAVINAQGGEISGNGGFVEVSGLNRTQYLGLTQLGATNGQVGNLLIDPTNFKFSTDASATLLNTSGNVNVWASRDILVDAAANFLNVGAGSVLSLNAGRHITITKALTTNGGNMSLNANTDTTAYGGGPASGTGNFTLAPTGSINTNGGGVALTGYDVNVQSTLNAGKYITANAARNVFVNQTGNITGLNGTNINLVAASANRMYGNLTTSNANVNLTAYASGVGDITGGLDIGSNSIYTANLSALGNSTVSLNGKLVSIYGTVNAGKSLNINALRQVTFNKANVAVNNFGRINVAGGTGVVVAGSNLTANNGIITINADSTGTGVGFFQNTVNSNINAGYGIVLIEGGNNLQQGANINAGLIGLFASAANSQIVFTPGSSTVAPLIGVYATKGTSSSILVNGNVSGDGCGLSAAEFIASGNISGTGRITTTALKLESFNGSIGTSASSRLGINTRLLNANAKNGDVYLNVYGGSVDLIGINRAKGKFFVQAIDPGKVRTFFGLVIAPSIQLVSK
ncbi:MAG: hypothetical protein K2X66_04950, partial [Cyanobacteria bacterium]|nr:hypothetical protein [Cyanobacteriota bacterium]